MAGKRQYRCVALMFLAVEPAIFDRSGGPGPAALSPLLRRTITRF